MELGPIRKALDDAGVDGWLFCDFHHRDPLAYRILGLDPDSMTSRRWYYYLPRNGEPIKLAHRVEPRKLDRLPGDQRFYLSHTELHEQLRSLLEGQRRVAMQYSPMNNVPYISIVDAGTIELIRSFGVEVVSSADLIQQFEAVTDEAGLASHREAGDKVQAIKDEAFAGMDEALRKGQTLTEFDVREFILSRFEQEGLTSDGAAPIVGFNEHPADPHFEPTRENAHTLHHGDTFLVDLWARRIEPPGLYYDVTWCGFAGQQPPGIYARMWSVVCEARDAGLEFVRGRFAEGRACHGYEVDDVVRGVVARGGFDEFFLHRTGHSIGEQVHGNGANIDNLETKDERRIVPGSCFSLEPGIYLDGKMAVRTEIDVCITPGGQVEVYGPVQDELVLIG